mgnify:CR=1 FL=1
MGLFTKPANAQEQTVTVIAGSCNFEGKLQLDSELQLAGTFKGDIQSHSTVVIATGANVTGDIHAEELIIKGQIQGVCVAKRIHILPEANVMGTLYTDQLSIDAGASFMGKSCAFPAEGRLVLVNRNAS